MVFGRKNKEIQALREEIAYLRGRLDSQAQKSSQPAEEEKDKDKLDRLISKVDTIRMAALNKKIKALERFLGKQVEIPESEQTYDIPSNPNPSIPEIISSIPAPMKFALNAILKQRYNITLDEIVADPTKAIPIINDIMGALNTIQQKKAEAEKENKKFNPYDPTLFVK